MGSFTAAGVAATGASPDTLMVSSLLIKFSSTGRHVEHDAISRDIPVGNSHFPASFTAAEKHITVLIITPASPTGDFSGGGTIMPVSSSRTVVLAALLVFVCTSMMFERVRLPTEVEIVVKCVCTAASCTVEGTGIFHHTKSHGLSLTCRMGDRDTMSSGKRECCSR
jgi:hypothetical protein